MNPAKVKTILAAYRPESDDTKNRSIRRALRQAERDPELQAWLASEQVFDCAFAARLQDCPAPAGLKEKILTEAQEPVTAVLPQTSPRRYLEPMPWAVAACFALAAFLGALLLRQPAPEADELFAAVQEHVQAQGYEAIQPGDWAAIHKTLGARQAPLPQVLPIKMLEMPGKGCLAFNYQGTPISLICFQGKETTYHLYIVNLNDLQEKVDIPEPKYQSFATYSSASWTADRQLYMMVVNGSPESLRDLL